MILCSQTSGIFFFFCLRLFNFLNPNLDSILMKMLPRRLQFTPMAFRLAHWCHNNLLISYLPEGGQFGCHQSSVQSLLFEQLMIPNLLTQRAPMFIIWFNNLPVTIAARIHPLASWGGLRRFNLHPSVNCRIFFVSDFSFREKKNK